MTERQDIQSSIGGGLDIGQSYRMDTSYNNLADQSMVVSSAKAKFENYLKQNNLNVKTVFKIADSNSDQKINIGEWKRVMEGLHVTGLTSEESLALFRMIDRNQTQTITKTELFDYFSSYQTAYLVRKLQE